MGTLSGFFLKPKLPPKRDFIAENKKKIKEIQQIKHQTTFGSLFGSTADIRLAENSKQNQRKRWDISKRDGSSASTNQTTVTKSTSVSSVNNKNRINNNRPDSTNSIVTKRDVSSQTTDVNDSQFLKDVIIRLPSAPILNTLNSNISKWVGAPTDDVVQEIRPTNAGAMPSSSEDDIPECIESFESISVSKVEKCSSTESNLETAQDKDKRSHRRGMVPNYLKRMQRENAAKLQQAQSIDPDCPVGHIALTEEERLESLELAQTKFNNALAELNKLPLSVHSLRILDRKRQLEMELNKLEENIRAFSRPKVFVKTDQ